MAVLVTGGAGYIGSHVVRALRRQGRDAIVLDTLETGHPSAVLGAPLVMGDIADTGLVRQVVLDHAVDAVIHIAGYKNAGESMQVPGRYFENNVVGTARLLRALEGTDVRLVVFSGSCSVYGTPTVLPVTEDAALVPESPYGQSKLMCEQMLQWYGTALGFRWMSLRYFNAAGASADAAIGEDFTITLNLVPLLVKACLGLRPAVQVFGTDFPTADGTAVRDYIHVEDLARGHLLALDHLERRGASRAVNLGTGVGSSVREVVAAIERVSGRRVPIELVDRRPGDPAAVWADNRLAADLLGWVPEHGLDEIVASAWQWHSTHPDGYAAAADLAGPLPGGASVQVRVNFLLDQVAGHITSAQNLRRVTEADVEIAADWHDISYYREGGAIERLRQRLPFVPTYVTGNLRAVHELRRGLRPGSYDAIYTNARMGLLFARRFARTPTMIDFDATPVQIDAMETYGSPRDPRPIAHVKWRLCRDMLHAARLLQAWSRWARQSAIDDYGVPAERIVVNPPGVPLDVWVPAGEPDRGGSGVRRVLFVGGDFDRKGGQLLLEWYRHQRPDEVELHLVTRADLAPQPGLYVYRDLTPNSDALLALYREADLFVMPSLGECFGIATVEAMAAGLPVIASDAGGTADIVEPGGNGFITKAGDVADLSAAIAAVLDHPDRRAAMRCRSRQLAEQRFDAEINSRLTLHYLKELVRGGPPGPR